MKLIELELSHFKGIKHFLFTPNGESASIHGANETGKTTIADAFTWLLFDRDTANRSTQMFSIKYAPGGEVMHNVNYGVKGTFEVDGVTLVLEKNYKENWVRPRGQKERRLENHTTDHFIDGVSVTKSNYKKRVEEIISYDRFMMLTLPEYFAETLHWSSRREILFEIAGMITDEQVIETDERLAGIPEIIEGKEPEDMKASLQSRISKVRKQLKESIPTRIDELERSLEEVPDRKKLEKKIEKVQKEREESVAALSQTKSDRLTKLDNQLQDLDIRKSSRRNELENTKYSEQIPDLRTHIQKLENILDDTNRMIRQKRSTTSPVAIRRVEEKIENRKAAIAEYRAEKPKDYKQPGDCPTCGQPLPVERVKDSRERHNAYVAEFNRNKASEIKTLQTEQNKLESELVKLKRAATKESKEIAKLEATAKKQKQEIEAARKELKEVIDAKPDVLSDEKYLELIEQERKLNDEKKKVESTLSVRKKELEAEIQGLKSAEQEYNRELAKIESQEKIRTRISELRADRQNLGEQLDKLEDDIWTIDLFIQAKARFVTERVNSQFQKVEWRLFNPLIGGGVEPTCEALYKGIAFTEGLNNAGRVQAGLDIIRTLSLFFGVQAPVFIDNRESVTHIDAGSLQVISLYVSPEDKELRIEAG